MATYVHMLQVTKVTVDKGLGRSNDLRVTLENYDGDKTVILLEIENGLQVNPVFLGDYLMPKGVSSDEGEV